MYIPPPPPCSTPGRASCELCTRLNICHADRAFLSQVSFQYSPGEDPNEKPTTSTLDMLAGSNLRKEMQRQGELVHCDGTTRGSALA